MKSARSQRVNMIRLRFAPIPTDTYRILPAWISWRKSVRPMPSCSVAASNEMSWGDSGSDFMARISHDGSITQPLRINKKPSAWLGSLCRLESSSAFKAGFHSGQILTGVLVTR
jgi:hypothetical protein